jgi:ribosome modulation factor
MVPTEHLAVPCVPQHIGHPLDGECGLSVVGRDVERCPFTDLRKVLEWLQSMWTTGRHHEEYHCDR